ncbi:DEAD/DEAH box helicase [Brevibacterium antiquum]
MSKGYPITPHDSSTTSVSSSTRQRRPATPKAANPESANAVADTTDVAPVTFAELGVPSALTDRLRAEGKTEAFPIQKDTLPDTLAGRDVLGRGKTGSGKTLAFAIPMVTRLSESDPAGRKKGRLPRGLILAPTRELATQITNVVDPLAQAYGMSTTTIFGGVKQRRQEIALNAGVDIVVACPGRLEDLLQQGLVSLDNIQVTVLDEADHMADLGFLPGVTRILARTPEQGQRMFFSATLDNGVDKLVRRFLHNEIRHSVDDPNSHVSAMTHHVFEVADEDKNDLIQRLASGTGRRILFTRTKHRAKRFTRQLTAQGIPAVDLHGNLSQGARDRNLAAFSEGNVRVLVATDVAARGVHVDSIELVVHVDPPTEHKAYLHRSGRTARAGSSGDVVTVMLPGERKDTTMLLRKAAIKVTPQKVTADSPAVADLVGEIADYVDPQIAIQAAAEKQKAEQPQGGQRSSSGRRRGGRGGDNRRGSENTRSGESSRSGQAGGRNSRNASGGRTARNNSQGSRSGGNAQEGRPAANGRGGRSGASASGNRRSEGTRSNTRGNAGNRRGSDNRGTSAETRGRHRSQGSSGGSRTVYSSNS